MPFPLRPRAARATAAALLAACALASCATARGEPEGRAYAARDTAVARDLADAAAAIRRGEFGRGHDLMRRATDADSASAMAWWRRSIAAELAHRGDDADRAIAEAERRAARAAGVELSLTERRLVRAQALWRAGDALGADSLLRAAVRDDARDADAWFGVAEVAYHAGPLYGRPLDLAREPWRRVVALDPASYAPIMHLVRLEARAGDTAAVRALLRRADATGARGTAAAESRVVAAYATGRAADTVRVTRMLDSLPHFGVAFLRDVVAGMLERPDLAVGIARRLVEAPRPPAVRANGHVGLARLHVGAGRWRAAMAELDRAAALDPTAAAWARAQLVALPFASVGAADVARARDALRAAADGHASAPLAPAGEPLAATVAAHLYAHLGATRADASLAGCDARGAADVRAICAVLHAGLRAGRAGADERASLAELEAAMRALPYQLAARSPYLAGTRERWRLAELLERAGRDADAERWYAAVPHGSLADHPYLAASHLRRATIRERAGDRVGAAALYARVVALLPAPDAELARLRLQADAGLRRTTAR